MQLLVLHFLDGISFSLKPLLEKPEKSEKNSIRNEKVDVSSMKEEKVIEEKHEVKNIYPSATQVHEKSEWYYLDSQTVQKGPFSWREMKDLYSKNEISTSTYIYGGDLEGWTVIGTNPSLLSKLSMD